MTIQFDPKSRAILVNTAEPARGNSVENDDPYPEPVRAVSEMELLFSGMKKPQANPADIPQIPDLERDILRTMPRLGGNSVTLGGVIERYKLLKKNLLDRRNNLSNALKKGLKPEEARDLIRHLNLIDKALQTVHRNMEKAFRAESQIREREIEAQRRG